MNENIWPKYGTSAVNNSWLLAEFIFNLQTARGILIIVASVAVYFVGISFPIPTVGPPGGATIGNWWFLMLFDQLFTGGAFGRGAFFCLGIFSTLALGSGSRRAGQAAKKGLIGRALTLILLAAITVSIFVVRGAVARDIRAIGVTFIYVVLGGIGIALINRTLTRHRGPQIIHLNIVILLYLHFHKLFGELRSMGRLGDLYLATAGVAFIAISTYYVFRSRIYIEVENVKSTASRRSATLELRGADENSLDLLALTSVILFICFAGVTSLLTGLTEMTKSNFLIFAIGSTIVLLTVWLVLVLVGRILASNDFMLGYIGQFLDTGEIIAIHDPRQYALQMLNNFWIIPNVPAGPATEAFIRVKMKRVLHKTFLIFGIWFFVILAIQFYAIYYGSGLLLFPYGTLVFLFLLLMCIGNLSMMERDVRLRFGHFRQMMRGRQRVVAKAYSLLAPGDLRHLDFSGGDAEYWGEEKFGDQMQHIIDVCRFLQQARVIPSRSELPKKTKIIAAVPQIVIGVVSGVLIAFLGGVLYVMVKPEGDVWQLIIPLFLGGLFSPNIIWNVLKRKRA